MGCTALGRCVLVLRCGLAGWCGISMQASLHTDTTVATYLLSYFMGCIALVRCVLVLRCGMAVMVWYPYADFRLHTDTTPLRPNHNLTPTHIEPEQYNP